MHIRVNKKTSASKPVKYAVLSSALNTATYSSGVWHDEESTASVMTKRLNHIRMTRDTSKADARFDA